MTYGSSGSRHLSPKWPQQVPPAGLEPATRCLEGSRSIQLSYRGVSPGYATSPARARFPSGDRCPVCNAGDNCVVAVAQVVRAPGCGPGGRGFKSPRSPSPAPLAQLAEQRTLNPRVQGSSPWGRTSQRPRSGRCSAPILRRRQNRRSGHRNALGTKRSRLLIRFRVRALGAHRQKSWSGRCRGRLRQAGQGVEVVGGTEAPREAPERAHEQVGDCRASRSRRGTAARRRLRADAPAMI